MNDKATTPFLKAVFAVVRKDLAAEFRGRELITSMLVFSLMVVLIFSFALDRNPRELREITSGVMWVTFAFAGILGLNRSLGMEKDGNAIDGLLLAPVDRSTIYFGKAISNLIFMMMVEIIVIPVFSIFYSINLFHPGLLLTVVLFTYGYVITGTLLAGMSVQARTRDVLLPILHLPVAWPIIMFSARASSLFLQGQGWDQTWSHINMLVIFNVVFTVLGYMFYDYVVEE